MSDLFEEARAIIGGESSRPLEAYRRLQNGLLNKGGEITLSDRDLVLAAMEASRRGNAATAIVALDELSLRMLTDETPGQVERRIA
jgi:hypothetical protein